MTVLTGSAAAQSLGEMAAKEKKRRAAQAAATAAKPSKAFTEEDLQKYVGERPVGTTEGDGSGSPSPAVSDPNEAAYSEPVPSQDQKLQELRRFDDQIRACKARVTAAQADLRSAEQNPEPSPSRLTSLNQKAIEEEAARQRASAFAKVNSLRVLVASAQRECDAMEETERTMRR